MVRRLLLGALAGLVGTAAMTAAMRILHRRLAEPERYALPPREIVQRIVPDERGSEQDLRTATLASHFAYGAASGGSAEPGGRDGSLVRDRHLGGQLPGLDPLGEAPEGGVSSSSTPQRPHDLGAR